MTRYVFDLDNTLIYTDLLNNDSYNYALDLQGFAPINNCKRITRDVVFNKFPDMNNAQKNEIIELKQEYFMNNLKGTIPNTALLKVLETLDFETCMLWTSSYEPRALAILEYYNICKAFRKILFSNKIELIQDIEKISEFLECDLKHLVFFEDNRSVIQDLQQLKLNVISV